MPQPRRITTPNAAFSLLTTAVDFARFLVAFMNGEGLGAATIEQMLTPQVWLADCMDCTSVDVTPSALSANNAWGLGWGLQFTDQGRSVWHWGDNQTFRGYTVCFPDQRIGLVYFSNSEHGLAIRDELVHRLIGGHHPAFDWLNFYRD